MNRKRSLLGISFIAILLGCSRKEPPDNVSKEIIPHKNENIAQKSISSEKLTASVFKKITIYSYPKGGMQAEKTVYENGIVNGGHMSGSPDAAIIYESNDQMSKDDMLRLKELIAILKISPPKDIGYNYDQSKEGYYSILIIFDDNNHLIYNARAESGKKQIFVTDTVQSVWDLVLKQKVGAW